MGGSGARSARSTASISAGDTGSRTRIDGWSRTRKERERPMESPPLTKRLVAEVIGTFGFFFAGFCGHRDPGHPGRTRHPVARHRVRIRPRAGDDDLRLRSRVRRPRQPGGLRRPRGARQASDVRAAPVLRRPARRRPRCVPARIVMFDGIGTISKPTCSPTRAMECQTSRRWCSTDRAAFPDRHLGRRDRRTRRGRHVAPIAIGLFIFTAATVFGPMSGGSFNPAVPSPRRSRGQVQEPLDLHRRPPRRWSPRRRRLQVVPPVGLSAAEALGSDPRNALIRV